MKVTGKCLILGEILILGGLLLVLVVLDPILVLKVMAILVRLGQTLKRLVQEGNTGLPRGVGPRAFVRPMVPPLGFNGPPYPGPMHPMYYYMPAVPMEPMRGPPCYIQNQPAPSPVLSPEAAELRSNNILTQVEYYFSDSNLDDDDFLKSLMDENGWVPVSKVADFNRLKKMTTDIQLIVDASTNSKSSRSPG